MFRSNIVYLHHATEAMPHCGLPGLEVKELRWEDSAWLFEPAAVPQPEKWPTLVNWRVSLSGCLQGQILHHPELSYGSFHKTDRIVDLRRFDHVRQPVAFSADGWCYRLGDVNEDHNHRTLAREWVDLMLAQSQALSCTDEPTIAFGRRDVFGLHRPV